MTNKMFFDLRMVTLVTPVTCLSPSFDIACRQTKVVISFNVAFFDHLFCELYMVRLPFVPSFHYGSVWLC